MYHSIISPRKDLVDPAQNPAQNCSSAEPHSTHQTEREAVSVCFNKQRLARFLGLSVRSIDRANTAGLLPCPDLICGRSPRWNPSTIEKWMRTKPRLPGRGGCRS